MGCLSRQFLERLIFAIGGARRFTQDSPVLPDVWVRYGDRPLEARDLLLTPDWASSAGELASRLRDVLDDDEEHGDLLWRAERPAHGVAYAHNTVAVRLTFEELVRLVLPWTSWWHRHITKKHPFDHYVQTFGREKDVRIAMDEAFDIARGAAARPEEEAKRTTSAKRPWIDDPDEVPVDVFWTVCVIGAIAFAAKSRAKASTVVDPKVTADSTLAALRELIDRAFESKDTREHPNRDGEKPLVYLVNVNRTASVAVHDSVLACKADAARRLFDIRSNRITWAIIDSGIDATHPAFYRRDALGQPVRSRRADKLPEGHPFTIKTRVKRTYDFTRVRDMLDPNELEKNPHVKSAIARDKAVRSQVKLLKQMLIGGREVDWDLLDPLLRVPHDEHYEDPADGHGTHVAGILGADWRVSVDGHDGTEPVAAESAGEGSDAKVSKLPWVTELEGVCPDIQLYDLRVLDEQGGSEFAVIAALQFIRHLNATHDEVKVHGANLSLEILHDVANYACGRTPVCLDADRLAASGTVVVAAAGNQGYLRYQTADGTREGYHTVSITDPGNAEHVITVGATHRSEPHNYGVSYFSSRGPTGDGRLKPDLVAPGEKIRAPLPGKRAERMEGTSMAAPHVSGAAALLMARNNELVGRPRRIKELLCENATDLGRERYFQGAGMLDILRAMQAV